MVLIHGMVNSSRHWESVALRLADAYTVIAPDLIGHGDSATPRGDYSLGAHAASIRDLLTAIGIEKATIVGHSLGGGVAMQFFYQFPQRTERLVLVSSGGLGHEVSPLLRGAALPGATPLLALATRPRVLAALLHTSERLQQRGSGKGVYLRADRAGAAAAQRARRPRGLPPDAALGDRRPGAACQRAGSALPVECNADPDRLGRRATTPSPSRTGVRRTKPPQAAASRSSRAPPTSPTWRIPRGSPRCFGTSWRRPGRHKLTTPTGVA